MALLLVGIVVVHAVAQGSGAHGAERGAAAAPSATTAIVPTTVSTTTPSLPPPPALCHDGAVSDVECSSTTAQGSVAQQAVASRPGSLLLPLTALPQWPAPRAAASQPSARASLRVILRT